MKRQQPTLTLTRNGQLWGMFVKQSDALRVMDKWDGLLKLTDAAGNVLTHYER